MAHLKKQTTQLALSLYTDCYQLCSLLYRTCLKALLRVVQNPAFNSDRSQKHKNRFLISLESFLSARLRLQLWFRLLSRGQCDQMARLFIPNLTIYINENWLNGIKIPKRVQHFAKYKISPTAFIIQPKMMKFRQILSLCSRSILP